MKPLTSSIRRHLLSWLLIPIASLCFIGACVTYGLAVDIATDAYDDSILDCAHSVVSSLSFSKSELTVDMPPVAKAILKHGDKDSTYYQIIDPQGNVKDGDVFIPDPPRGEEIGLEPIFYDGMIDQKPVRIACVEVTLQKNKLEHVVIKVAETLSGKTQLIQSIFLGVVIPQVVLIVLSGLAVWLGVARGLAPLGRLKEAVESRNPSDLRPLSEENVPKEVKPLVMAINKLLTRLQEDRESQKRFLSNAAHQLRTPLAGLKTQTELALRRKAEADIKESLQHIHTSASRASRLAQQLLALARVEPSVFKNITRERLDLNKVAREVTQELVMQSIAKKIDLGFEECESALFVAGDRSSLHEMMFNLIENAVFYTQSGGSVTVRIEADKSGPVFCVEDNGPGIPRSERELVFERFYRVLGNKESGSGLGLSIAREIAAAHDANIELHDGENKRGTLVRVCFHQLDFTPEAAAAAAAASASAAPQARAFSQKL